MRRIVSIVGLAAALAAAIPVAAQDSVVEFSTEDPEMNAAIAKAGGGLPEFWDRFADPADNEADFSLKLGISDGTETEHFWCGEIAGTARSATCVISNEPVNVSPSPMGNAYRSTPTGFPIGYSIATARSSVPKRCGSCCRICPRRKPRACALLAEP